PIERLIYTLYLTQNNYKALVGAGHVVATYRRDLISKISLFNLYKMGGDSEEILDRMAPEHGYYRLTTSSNFASHMGNTVNKEILDTEVERPTFNMNDYPKFRVLRVNPTRF